MSAFASVVVGVDGGQGGRDALALARVLAPDAAALTLVHVDVMAPAYAAVAGQLREEVIAQELEAMAAGLRDKGFGGTVDRRSTLAPTVADGLADAARAHAADLLVVGSSRRGRAARLLLGDDTRAVLRRAPCPVAVARSGEAVAPGTSPASIAVGYDAARAAALQEAGAAVAGVAGADRVEARLGRVCDGLLDLATDADLLVVGLRHRSPLGRLLRGSTAEELLRELPCPLLAVPED